VEIVLEQRSSITFIQGPKSYKIGMVAGHRLETQLINRIYCLTTKQTYFSVDIEQKHLIKDIVKNIVWLDN